jgi:hypothetical protein
VKPVRQYDLVDQADGTGTAIVGEPVDPHGDWRTITTRANRADAEAYVAEIQARQLIMYDEFRRKHP